MPIPCSQFVRRAAALLPMLVMLVMALATPAAAQKTKTPSSTTSYSDGSLLNVGVNITYGVSVTPDNQSQIVSPGATLTFRVTNTGTVSDNYSITANCTPQCSVSPLTLSSVAPGASMGRNVTVSLGTYFGTVTVRATGSGGFDTGSIIPSGPTYTVGVGPDGTPDYWFEAGQAGTANFTVSNSGNSQATYSLSGSCDAVATGCSAPPGSVTVSPSSSVPVPITFTAGAAGSSGYVRLNASGPSSDGGTVHVLVYSHTVSVAAPAAVSVDPGSYTASFYVTNTGNVATTYNLASTCGGQITGCSASLGQITVAAGGTSPAVSVPYTAVNRGDAGTVTLTASWAGNGAVNASAAMSVTVKHSYAVAVTPDNQAQIVSPSSSVTFYVQNLGSITTSFNLSVNCACGISPSTTISVPNGVTNGVNVTVSLNGYTGTVVLTASDAAHGTSDTGSIIVTAPTYTVSASPDTNPQTVAQPIDANKPGSQTFNIYNMGNSPATYTISVSCPSSSFLNCNWATSLQVPAGATLPLPVSFTAAGGGGVGTMTLTASAQNTSDQATARWQVNTHYSLVTPKGGTANAYVGGGRTQVFSVKNTGNVTNSYTLTAPCLATVTGCSASPASISNLTAGNTASVTVTYTGSAPGAGTARLATANTVDPAAVDTGSVIVTVKPTYTVAVTPDGATPQAEAWTQAVVPFSIANSGTTSGSYFFILSCSGSAVHGNCLPDVPSIVIAAGQAAVVNVRFPAGAPGETANISLVATSSDDGFFTDAGSATLTVTKYAVTVTPDGQAVTPAAYASDTRTFTVTNTGTTNRIFRLQAACAPPAATACSASRDTATLLANTGSIAVNVSYTAGDPGATGTVRLIATDTLGRSADGGTLAVTVGTSVANNQVQFKQINPGTTIERSACLVFSIVRDVADECGALRIVHPLPAVTTLGKARVPTLIYSSDQLQGPTLAVNVILADTTTPPQSVQLTVTRTWSDGHVNAVTQTYPGIDWQANNKRRRIAVPNVASGGIGILRYSVSVSLVYPGGVTKLAAPVDNSELAFVDRTNSTFGAGWWLAGLEQLFFGQPDSSVLWVAGDGSTRKYVNQHTAVVGTSDSVYLAAAFDRPDTLLLRSDGMYRREAGNGLFVEFNGLGQHTRTVNRLGYATAFTYQGKNLSSIQLPPLQAGGGPAFTYTFAYNSTSGLLDSIIAPSVNNRTRKVALTRNGATGGVQTIKELLDSTYQVGFEFQPGSQLIYAARLDRRNARTSFAYEPSSPTIASFTTATGTGSDVVSHTFRTATAIGAAGTSSANLDTVYFRYDGPRPTAVGDTTLFWLDRFGAPVRILNALGQETRVARGDPRFPGLATETRGPGPKFFTAWATYDVRGNLRASTQIAPYDVLGVDATTTYAWDPKWDEVVRVTLPEGEVTNFGIDATTGNRKWQEDGRGITSHVDFAYYTDAPRYGLLKSVTVPARSAAEPGTATSTYDYDASANLRLISGARREEHLARDSVGRVAFDSTKIDSISGRPGYWQIQETDYDLSDRTIRTYASGTSAATGSDNASETVSAYNLEGGRDSVKVRSAGVNNPTIIVRRRFTYDLLGRVRTEGVEQDGHAGTWLYDENQYDEAGNVKTRIARTGAATTMTYDALNRLASRTMPSVSASNPLLGLTAASANSQVDTAVKGAPYAYTSPADVATFSYDPATGDLLDANNAWAKVHRTYFANGQLKTETQRLRTWGGDTTDVNYTHLYDLTFAYDRNGRRVSLRYPTAFGSLTAAYGYDPVTGELATVTDLQGKQIQLAYDYRGSLVQRLLPSPTSGQVFTERFHFTDDGDLNLWAMRGPGSSRDSVENQTFTFDARGKQLALYDSLVINGGQEAAVYDGLGQLMKSTSKVNGNYSTTVYTIDGIGNVLSTTGSDGTVFGGGNSTGSSGSQGGYLYDPVTGRRTVSYDATSTGDTLTNHRPFITRYDAAGNAWWYGRFVFDQNLTQNERRSYYAANNVLMAADARTWDTPTTVNTALSFSRALEEYRYDALGRRVLVLATRTCSGMMHPGTLIPRADCLTSTIRRTVWDGAAELGEIQMPAGTGVDIERDSLGTEVVNNAQQTPRNLYPFYGRVGYVYAPGGIDRPLAVTRFNYSTLQPAGTGSWQSTAAPTFTFYPIWNTHGQANAAITLSATPICSPAPPGSIPPALCVRYDVGDEWLPYLGVSVPQGSWQGTLLTDKSDAAGTKYRRNRYYDPQSGRFTQEDPIGLAGGLNAYGFAGGDPVNFSDPFGLCKNSKGEDVPCPDKDKVAKWLRDNASDKPTGMCARACRSGLEAGGFDSEGRPVAAGDYGPFLLSRGAGVVPEEHYKPEQGDMAVFAKTTKHKWGHIQVYDGKQWISDFKQNGFVPYRDKSSAGEHTIYRFPGWLTPVVINAGTP